LIEKAVQPYLANQLIHKKFFAFPFQEWTQFWTAFEGLSTSSVNNLFLFQGSPLTPCGRRAVYPTSSPSTTPIANHPPGAELGHRAVAILRDLPENPSPSKIDGRSFHALPQSRMEVIPIYREAIIHANSPAPRAHRRR
jgi:hypothetical protein